MFQVGLGIHGEAGIRREPLPDEHAARHVAQILVSEVMKAGSFEHGMCIVRKCTNTRDCLY